MLPIRKLTSRQLSAAQRAWLKRRICERRRLTPAELAARRASLLTLARRAGIRFVPVNPTKPRRRSWPPSLLPPTRSRWQIGQSLGQWLTIRTAARARGRVA